VFRFSKTVTKKGGGRLEGTAGKQPGELLDKRGGTMFKKVVLGLTLALLVTGLVGLAQDAPKYGGTLKVAIFDESPMLDMSMTTASSSWSALPQR
jgi:hypothetical protein